MSDELSPAPVAEGTDPALPEVAADVAAPEPEAPQTPAELSHNRRLIEAAKAERRAVAARREVDARLQRAEAIERQAAERDKQLQALQAQIAQMEDARSGAKKKPRNLIEQHGLTLDDVVRDYLGEEQTPQALMAELEDRARGETAAVKAQVEELKKALSERDAKEQERNRQYALQQFSTDIKNHLTSDPDRYEYTISRGQEGEVLTLIDLAWTQKGVALTVQQAADMIEETLEKEALSYAKTKKLASRFTPQESNAAPPQAGKPAPQAKQATDAREPKASTTLTAQLATSPAQPVADSDDLDKDAAIARAVKKIADMKAAKRATAK